MADFTPQEFEEYKKHWTDRQWRRSHLYHVLDKNGDNVLFVPNSIQAAIQEWYRTIILKNRQPGVTTKFMIDYTDLMLFNNDMQIGVIAHKKEEATKIIKKVEFAYKNLPSEIRDDIKIDTKNKGEIGFSNGSAIYASTSYRSGTLQFLHITEMGYICAKTPDRAEEIYSGAFNSVSQNCRITIESTAMGRYGWFADNIDKARKRQAAKQPLTQLTYFFQFFPWMMDNSCRLNAEGVMVYPRLEKYFAEVEALTGYKLSPQQRAFYTQKEEEQGTKMKENFPSTPDEAFEQTIEGAYYAEQMMKARVEGRITKVPVQSGVLIDTFWDIGMDDETAIWFCQTIGREHRIIDYMANTDKGHDYYYDEMMKKGYRYNVHIFPHDIKVREWGNKGVTRYESVAALFGRKNCKICPDVSIADGIDTVRKFLSMCVFDAERCEEGIDGLDNYCKVWDSKNGTYLDTPAKGPARHPADAFRMGAIWKTMTTQGGVIQTHSGGGSIQVVQIIPQNVQDIWNAYT